MWSLFVGLDGATVQQQQPRGPRDDDDDDDDDVMTELNLKCVVDGRPPPSVEWLRNYVRSDAPHLSHTHKTNPNTNLYDPGIPEHTTGHMHEIKPFLETGDVAG